MRKIITNKFRLLLLSFTALAFLAGQGANAHIHLPENHHHDGSHHQHSAEVHHDHFAEDDLFASHVGALELESDYRAPTPEKQKKAPVALAYSPPALRAVTASIRMDRLTLSEGWLYYPELATRHPRAPPINL